MVNDVAIKKMNELTKEIARKRVELAALKNVFGVEGKLWVVKLEIEMPVYAYTEETAIELARRNIRNADGEVSAAKSSQRLMTVADIITFQNVIPWSDGEWDNDVEPDGSITEDRIIALNEQT